MQCDVSQQRTRCVRAWLHRVMNAPRLSAVALSCGAALRAAAQRELGHVAEGLRWGRTHWWAPGAAGSACPLLSRLRLQMAGPRLCWSRWLCDGTLTIPPLKTLSFLFDGRMLRCGRLRWQRLRWLLHYIRRLRNWLWRLLWLSSI